MNYQVLSFTIFCISNVSAVLGKSAREVYHQMQEYGIINDYIVPCYDVLHTFPKDYIVEDLISFMKKRGALS